MPMVSDLLFRTVDGAFAVDAQQRVAFWNRGCEQLLKRPAKDALGRRCCEVLRGCNSAGEAVCRSHCQMAELAGGGPSPGSFALSVEDGDGATQRLNVSIVLMPSPSKGQWTVLHMLHRAAAVTSLDMLHGASQAGKRPAGSVNGDGDMVADQDGHKDKARMPAAAVSALTTREDEIFRLLAEGLSLKTISARLHISLVTVRNHVQHIHSKLDVHSQVETVAYAYRHQLV